MPNGSAADEVDGIQDNHQEPWRSFPVATPMICFDAGIDITTVALWLGHESTDSTQPYLHADLGMKQRALDRLAPPQTLAARRYKPDDQLLTFLEAL
jgi:integrase/recombinase XerD